MRSARWSRTSDALRAGPTSRSLHGAAAGVLLTVIAPLVVGCEEDLRDESGDIDTEGSLSASSLRVGDCLDEPLADSFVAVSVVPCERPHNWEVFAVVDHPADKDTPYPGDARIGQVSFDLCFVFFDGYIGRAYADSRLDISVIMPTRESWDEDDDREISCVLYDLDTLQMRGSMKDSGR